MNDLPGANACIYKFKWHSFNGRHMLESNCDGTVLVTREHCNTGPNIKMMEDLYNFRNYENIYILTFNVIPRKRSNKFLLLMWNSFSFN
ncbi:hypothetical protein Mgra_00006001 [Meloidogyne graminicola]|uniref:Uncharacterized protein n=1 Tax=Meloidogyne graminicola TaxID=189291 RepID=A0A8S9ZMT2_9BILA|nr:hypothetical protein Mgra_00006001 [Meloidogyne graminicola]